MQDLKQYKSPLALTYLLVHIIYISNSFSSRHQSVPPIQITHILHVKPSMQFGFMVLHSVKVCTLMLHLLFKVIPLFMYSLDFFPIYLLTIVAADG